MCSLREKRRHTMRKMAWFRWSNNNRHGNCAKGGWDCYLRTRRFKKGKKKLLTKPFLLYVVVFNDAVLLTRSYIKPLWKGEVCDKREMERGLCKDIKSFRPEKMTNTAKASRVCWLWMWTRHKLAGQKADELEPLLRVQAKHIISCVTVIMPWWEALRWR